MFAKVPTWMNQDTAVLNQGLGSVIMDGQLGSVSSGVVVTNIEALNVNLDFYF